MEDDSWIRDHTYIGQGRTMPRKSSAAAARPASVHRMAPVGSPALADHARSMTPKATSAGPAMTSSGTGPFESTPRPAAAPAAASQPTCRGPRRWQAVHSAATDAVVKNVRGISAIARRAISRNPTIVPRTIAAGQAPDQLPSCLTSHADAKTVPSAAKAEGRRAVHSVTPPPSRLPATASQ